MEKITLPQNKNPSEKEEYTINKQKLTGFTSDIRAEEAVPRSQGSMDSKVSSRSTAVSGNSAHLSRRELS